MISKRKIAAALFASVVAMPANAALLNPFGTGVAFDAFNIATQGTQLVSKTVTGCSSPAATFCGTLGTAVYRNTTGTLDFYYQFTRNLKGGTDPVERITASYFPDYSIFAYAASVDVDGAGSIFTTDTNTGAAATASRTGSSGILGINFDIGNPVTGTQSSATYIFRTNAISYTDGLFGVIDGQTFAGSAYMPTGAAVPEPGTWALFIGGFGLVGGAMRRSRRKQQVTSLV